jgi:predicted AAA+ superfamily ATPase
VLERLATAVIRERLRDAPAVVVVGPRQCGKTTLAR